MNCFLFNSSFLISCRKIQSKMLNYTKKPLILKLETTAKSHYRHLILNLDTVKNAKQLKLDKDELLLESRNYSASHPARQFQSTYICPLLISFFLLLDSLYVFYENDFKYSSEQMESLVFHRIFPKE